MTKFKLIIVYFIILLIGFTTGLYYKENQWIKSCIKNEVAYYKVDSTGGTDFYFKDVWMEYREGRLIFSKELDSMYNRLMIPDITIKPKRRNPNDSI